MKQLTFSMLSAVCLLFCIRNAYAQNNHSEDPSSVPIVQPQMGTSPAKTTVSKTTKKAGTVKSNTLGAQPSSPSPRNETSYGQNSAPYENVKQSTTSSSSLVTRSRSGQIASGPRLASAIGHYARSRSLLITAVTEFEKAVRFADPSALLNAETWKREVLEKAQELDKILDPQPRVTESGIRYDPDSRLIGKKTR
jgi:hypothetical protein